jgi:tetratricopeptide (TPR) repeat protein
LRELVQADLEAGHFDRAAALLGRLDGLGPPTGEDWMLRARVAIARGRTDEALAALARVPDDHPNATEARFRRGQLELRRGRTRAAEAAFLHALRLYPQLVQARRELVYIYGMQLRRAELGAQFRALAELEPLSFQDTFVWCLTRGCTWDPAETVETLGRFVRADPDDRWSRLGLVEALRQLGRFGEAERVLSALPASDPDARAIRVRLALDRGDVAAAETLLAEGPADHPGLALLRGRTALLHHDAPTAVRHLRAAFAGAPDDRDVQFYLGQALRLAGDAEAAEPLLQAARKQDDLAALVGRAGSERARADPKLPLRLGAACEAARRLPEAIAWYELALSRDPLDREARSALSRLKRPGPGSKKTGDAGSDDQSRTIRAPVVIVPSPTPRRGTHAAGGDDPAGPAGPEPGYQTGKAQRPPAGRVRNSRRYSA